MPTNVIPAVLQSTIDEFNKWADELVTTEQERNTIDETLYHYTDGRGLKGILESQTIWFTDYRHMNDPSELTHGIDIAKDVVRVLANGSDGRVRLFLETLSDMFSVRNFSSNLEFLIASFSKERDDLGQWRAYADNGRGYAIGFAPHLFAIKERKPASVKAQPDARPPLPAVLSIRVVEKAWHIRSLQSLRTQQKVPSRRSSGVATDAVGPTKNLPEFNLHRFTGRQGGSDPLAHWHFWRVFNRHGNFGQ